MKTMKYGIQAASTVAVVLLGASGVSAQAAGQRDVRAVPVADAWAAGWLGVSVDMRVEQRGQDRTTSVVVARVMEDGPAAVAGLEAGDVIVRVNGRKASPASFEAAARALHPGDTIQVTVERRSRTATLTGDLSIVAGAPPESPVTRLPEESAVRVQGFIDRLDSLEWRIEAVRTPDRSGRIRISSSDGEGVGPGDSFRGLAFILRAHFPDTITERLREAVGLDEDPTTHGIFGVQDGRAVRPAPALEEAPRSVLRYLERRDLVAGARMTRLVPDLADYFGAEEGLLVLEVIRWTPAAEAGLLPGDVLVEVDGRTLESVEALRLAWTRGAEEGLVLSVVRQGERMELRLPG